MKKYEKYKQKWREHGFCIIKDLIDNKIMNKVVNYMKSKYTYENCYNDFGSKNMELEFPTFTILDKITMNEKLIDIVKYFLNCNNIILTQSDAWGKTGKKNKNPQSNKDQRMHMDYGNHMFLHPLSWNNIDNVAVILYLSNTKKTNGATRFVSKKKNPDLYKEPYIHMPGLRNYTFINNRTEAEKYMFSVNQEVGKFREKLYKNEIKMDFEIGDILFYRLDLWHRGTPVKEGEIRYVMNMAWKNRDSYWINNWNRSLTKHHAYYGKLEKMFVNLTPKQRGVLGIPNIGDKYWNKERLEKWKERFPDIDIKPYLSKL